MKKIHIFLTFLLMCAALLWPVAVGAAVNWQYFETEHFNVIYHPEVEAQAKEAAQVAEQVFADNSSFTGFEPYRKIAIIVSGLEDFSNGESIPQDVIKLWVNPLNTATRVDRDWLKNLVTHELTHILQMEATFGATYLEQKLTGASTSLGLPPNTLYPAWLLEGAAQYGSARQGFDGIDRKRAMVMEQRVQSGQFYTAAELYWNRGDIGGEGYYNFGFGFFDYLMRTYGEEQFVKLQKFHNAFYILGLDAATRTIYNKSLSELVAEWKNELETKFPVRYDRQVTRDLAPKPQFSEQHDPLLLPDGSVIFAQNNLDRPSSEIKLWQTSGFTKVLLESPFLYFTRLALSPDGKQVLYTAYNVQNDLVRYDLYELDVKTRKTRRLTEGERVLQARYFKDGYLVLKNDFGKAHLYYLVKGQWTQLTDSDYNFQISDFVVSPSQKRVAINFNYNGKRGIGILETGSWTFEKVYYPPEGLDWILGNFINNDTFTLSWDRLDHYDLYTLNIATGSIVRETNTREDILWGQLVTDEHGETTWLGQIYDSAGFGIAKGSTGTDETTPLSAVSGSTTFAAAAKAEPDILTSGKYHSLTQLRRDYFMPYILSGDSDFGVQASWSDPMAKLQIATDLGWNLDQKSPLFSLSTYWSGTNPGFAADITAFGKYMLGRLTQFYNHYPYSLVTEENLALQDRLTVKSVDVQLSRSLNPKHPGATTLLGGFYPNAELTEASYDLILHHSITWPVGYKGDQINSTTLLSYSGGDNAGIGWDRWLWIYPAAPPANRAVLQHVNYRQNVADLSLNIADALQTGRLYLNTFADAGIVRVGDTWTGVNMLGIGAELETQLFHLSRVNWGVEAGINTSGLWSVRYTINSPF